METLNCIPSEVHNDDRLYPRTDEIIDLDILRAEAGIVIDAFKCDEY